MLIDIIRNSVKVFDLPAGMSIVVQPSSSGAVGTLSLAGGSVALTAASTSGAAGTAAGPFSAPCKIAVGAVGEVSVRIGPQKHLGAYTFANRPSAAAAGSGGQVTISDLGPIGAQLVSDGTDYHPMNGSALLGLFSVPVGIACDGTVGANGALTLGTATPVNFSTYQGIWLYLPAGAAYVGSAAGFYWCVMSSTTAGTIYNNTYTPGVDSGAPPSSPTAIAASGPGAYTGVTTEVTAFSVTVPGGLMCRTSHLQINGWSANNNSGGTKTVRMSFGGTTIVSPALTTNQSTRISTKVVNAGSVAKQSMAATQADGTASGNGTVIGSANTASNQSANMTLQLGTSTDLIFGLHFTVELQG